MAYLEFKNVRIAGFSAGVPKRIEENRDYPYFEEGEAEKFIASTGSSEEEDCRRRGLHLRFVLACR